MCMRSQELRGEGNHREGRTGEEDEEEEEGRGGEERKDMRISERRG